MNTPFVLDYHNNATAIWLYLRSRKPDQRWCSAIGARFRINCSNLQSLNKSAHHTSYTCCLSLCYVLPHQSFARKTTKPAHTDESDNRMTLLPQLAYFTHHMLFFIIGNAGSMLVNAISLVFRRIGFGRV